MLNTLYRYLVLHKELALPGIGSLSVAQAAAVIENSKIHPPRYTVLFHPGTALTDKQFYRFLAAEEGISEVDAVRSFQSFAYELRKEVQSNSQVELTGLGILRKNTNSDISFEPALSLDHYFPVISLTEVPSITAEEEIHDTSEEHHGIEVYPEDETVIKKDRWWIWALLLFIIACVAIAYHYFSN